ncbi:MAG: copper chaperone PCu(A)C [Bacteroidia bacterium]|jgi:hypothetical protein
MTILLHRRHLLRSGLAAGASFVVPSARACEYFSPNLRIVHPWTRATEAGFAIVCMKFDDVTLADRLIAVHTPVAEGAEMGGPGAAPAVDFVIPQGQVSTLGEGGTHLRLIGLKHALEVARSYPMDLVFERGGTVAATLNVDYTGFRFK